MYAREIEGETFTFGVSGKLIRNVLVMYDRQTDSLWSQLIGEAVEGEMKGTRLEYLPSWFTTWEEWKRMHPDTIALRKRYAGARDPYASYYRSGSAGVIGETLHDDRLYTKEFVVGVELDGLDIAYPFSALDEEPVVNHAPGDVPLLITFDPDNATSAVFSRMLEEQTLTFSAEGTDRMTDAETGSVWDRFSGVALDGPMAGKQLERVKSTTSFWFGWKDFHPETLVYGIDS